MATRWTKKQLDGFHDAAQSLKLYRRAELQKDTDGTSIIEELYVDPLPNDHVFQTMMKANTTFLIGRKGTGKSTIFQRAQHELRKRPMYAFYASAYIDIKTIFESSQVDPSIIAKVDSASETLPQPSLEKLRLYKSFLRAIIHEITKELKERVRYSMWDRIKQFFSGSIDELFEGLDSLLADIDNNEFYSIAGLKNLTIHSKNDSSEETDLEGSSNIGLWPTPELKASLAAKDSIKISSEREHTYADILMLEFNIKDFLTRLKALLNNMKIKHLYLFIDDFSELPQDAMAIVVDTLLAPLNNWSEELIKFKVAAYPGMIHYGAIDKTKIDEINLDLYKLYGTSDVPRMEEKAIDFTRRLVEQRVNYYCSCDVSVFIEPKQEDIWRIFFYASMANPRNLGYILFYLYESHLIYEKPIGLSALRDAARRYYEEKIEIYFKMNRFLQESFTERSSIFSLKELLEDIIKRARELRTHQGSKVLRELSGRPPTSHFHVVLEVESLLSTLELNFFLTKYYEMSDRDGRKVSVFALNYGLCQKSSIAFGRPTGKYEYRLYFIERIFDYTPILESYLKRNQEIICNSCKNVFPISDLPSLQKYRMMCPKCLEGTCQVINLSKKYEAMLNSIDSELLLPRTELGILQTLRTEKTPMFAAEIAEDLDCSYQLVGKRGKILADRGLVERTENEQGRRLFELTETAEKKYFSNTELDEDELDIGDETD
jgi:DNA-binding MarR family transcriptional regulator